jgi:phosphatidylinositol glycan class T
LKRLFDREVKRLCPVSESTIVNLAVLGDIDAFTLALPSPLVKSTVNSISTSKATYILNSTFPTSSIGVSWSDHASPSFLKPLFEVKRYTTGFGQEHGGLAIDLYNRGDSIMNVTLFQMVPWYFKFYLHTLTVNGVDFGNSDVVGDVAWLGSIDRGRPSVLEMEMRVGVGKTSLAIDFDKGFIRYLISIIDVGILNTRQMRTEVLILGRLW